ncbi:hypothetical protein C0V77_21770 [Emticicia sp. TH156]|nr:hypothetical protein C0V77_21770 [Emticicia sp. TH156]
MSTRLLWLVKISQISFKVKNIRYYIFWLVDYLKGSKIRKHYKEIESIYKSEPGSVKQKNNRLFDLLTYATQNTAFYKDCVAQDLSTYPVLTKQSIMRNIEALFSREYADIRESLKTMTTSGSTGTPLKVYQNVEKFRRNKADLLFFYKIGGYDIGDRFYFMRTWTKLNRKPVLSRFFENLKEFNLINLDIEGANQFTESMVADTRPKVLLAYASTIHALMDKIRNVNINWSIKAFFTGAEELPVNIKNQMQETFRCPVMSRYSNQECGILGQQPITGENFFRLNEGSYHFEFLKIGSDENAEEGEKARIVVTDLFNKAMPIIRYDTGDIGVFRIDEEGKRILSEINGRYTDFLKTNDGKMLSPHVITNLMWEYNHIVQFQFIQESLTAFKMILKCAGEEDIITIAKDLETKLRDIFGQKSVIEIIRADEIPSEKSGKRKYIISKV